MELTGKAKVDFEKWFDDTHKHTMLLWGESVENTGFYELTDSMKYGVYVDWFDSVGIVIDIDYGKERFNDDSNKHWFECIGRDINEEKYTGFATGLKDTRHEARTAAITKATELYNNRV